MFIFKDKQAAYGDVKETMTTHLRKVLNYSPCRECKIELYVSC